MIVVLKKIVKPLSATVVFMIFLKPQLPKVVFYTKKNKNKIYVDAYMNTKDQFDKYFEMGTILTIFFNKWIILDINSVIFFPFFFPLPISFILFSSSLEKHESLNNDLSITVEPSIVRLSPRQNNDSNRINKMQKGM